MDMKIKKIKDARKNEQIVQASHTAAHHPSTSWLLE
jgi:hypothetical protein